MSPAPVHSGILGGSLIVNDYYRFSQLETIGPAQIETESTTRSFSTLDELLDHILATAEQTHIVVNHGSPTQGLLIRFSPNSPYNATGLVAQALANLVDALVQGTLPPFDGRLLNVALQMGVSPPEALLLLEKFVRVRQRNPILHFRGCNLGGNTAMLYFYKLLFGAALITAPNCRMFYLRIRPRRPASGTSIAQLAVQAPSTANTRRRLFQAPGVSSMGQLLVDVRDIDGHTNVDSPLSVLDDPAQAQRWGELLTGRWTNTAPEFVLPVLWNDYETSFHCPLEVSYRQRLSMV
ncbi:hypothetical protein [Bacillus cereus]|uniref:hypothetical protein n=1 Tax=Bacillus cereus TaxID=1396 RepID=UPI000BECF4E0|nr:hypothetical protein [Bacillus cereus]PED29439.1 hypothetical protein CON13_25255 [Bacillus cereus]PEE50289.1 hypothetical protein COM80_26035 [Bacillus cereus]PFL96686.1 hypothetical protein COJ35_08630 [Bacillus cereus]PFV66752.1 hypothetical protein COL16_23830 [Bacillus cereus]PGS40013.1 hypothetical protein COC56_01090 [Bacillus cereus]